MSAGTRPTEAAIWRRGPEAAFGGARPTAEHALLLRIIADRGDDGRAAPETWCRTFDPRKTVDGGTFRLLPMVFHRMQQWNIQHEVRPLLKGVYRRSLVANSRLVHTAAPVMQALTDRGLAPVLLKGAALVADHYYPTLAARPMDDVDVYVTPDARAEAHAILDGLGWHVIPPFSQHANTFHAPDGAGRIDLHWHALNAVRTPGANQVLMSRVREVDGLGLVARAPDCTSQLLITLIHGAEPNLEPPVRWAADALLLMAGERQSIDWQRVIDFARTQYVGLRLSRMLHYLRGYAGDNLPPAVIETVVGLPRKPIEKWERRMMTSDDYSLTMRVSKSIVRASGARRSARSPSLALRMVALYHDQWGVSWMAMPKVAVGKVRNPLTLK